MGSHKYFRFLPVPNHNLDFGQAIRQLELADMKFDNSVSVYTTYDDGVPATFGEEITIQKPVSNHLPKLLGQKNTRAEIQCFSFDLWINCTFGSPHITPTFEFNVKQSLWIKMNVQLQRNYELILVRAARASGAPIIIDMNDPPDIFDANIALIDNRWFIDQTFKNRKIPISRVFLQPQYIDCLVLSDDTLQPTDEFVEDYQIYRT